MPGHETDPPERLVTRSPELVEAEAEIARTRERVSQSVMALRQAVAKRTDWREWVRQRPGLFLAAAFAAGLIWGHRSGRRPAREAGEKMLKRGGTWTWK